MADYYSQYFANSLLNSKKFFDQYFYNDNGDLYVTVTGGMTGYSLKDLEIEFLNEKDKESFYNAKYTIVDISGSTPHETKFSVIEDNGEYKLNTTEFFPLSPAASKS